MRDDIVTYVTAQCPSFREVKGVADLASALSQKGGKKPGAYVFLLRTSAGPNKADNRVRQQITSSYAILIVTRHANEKTGAKTSNENDDLIKELESKLLGWQPASNYTAMELGGGALVALQREFHVWQEVYITKRQATQI